MVSNGRGDGFFLWLDSFDPHEPWDPPIDYTDLYAVPEYDGRPITWGGGFAADWSLAEIRHIRSQYAGTITLVDRWTGEFLETVDRLGLLDRTMIIFLSDHGEPLGEHGIIKKVQPWPYDELSHIPLIVRLPDSIKCKKRSDAFVGTPDIAPTILSFLGIDIPSVMQGTNLLAFGDEPCNSEIGISGFHKRSWSIRDRGWSYYRWIDTQSSYGSKEKPELYKFVSDFVPPRPSQYTLGDQSERENLFQDEPDVTEDLGNRLVGFIRCLSPSPGDLMAKDFMKKRMLL